MAGGGELGARMRALDWSQNPLGAPEKWPQSLKTCVRIILTSRQPMFVWWGDQLVNLYNDAYKSIVGDKHPQALGQPASIVWREIWDEVGPRAESSMLRNEGTYDEALLLIMERYGYAEETYYTFSYSPVPNDDGKVGGIICANSDDTRRIIGERQIALLRELAARAGDARTWHQACKLSADALRTNARDLPFALIYLVDADRRGVTLASTAGIERGHAAAPELAELGDNSVWPLAEVMHPRSATQVIQLDARHSNVPSGAWELPPSQAVALPIAPSGEHGRAGVLIVGLNPFRQYDDSYSGFLQLVAGQISASIAHAEAYEEEKKRAEALAEIDRAKTAFFSNVSHEFRTPLTLMMGPLQDALGSESVQSVVSLREGLSAAHRNSLRLLKLVNTLLDFSRIEAHRVQATYEAVSIGSHTADLASVFRSAVDKAGMSLTIDCRNCREQVYLDRDMWEKIVLNLLSNAFKYTLEGGIRVTTREDNGRAVLTVADTGTGIPADALPHLFERFYRVPNARGRTHEGTGIGLALVHELVKLHGGSIHVESQVGRGTTFTVSVPLGVEHLPRDRISAERSLASTAVGANAFVEEALRWLPVESSDRLNDTTAAEAQSIRSAELTGSILLADDNADMRDYVQRLLRGQGYRVVAVADGVAALRAARESSFDLVLSDVMMPQLDGVALVKAMRADERTRATPVILLSARAGQEARSEGLEIGADDYLFKPFSARELLARVGSTLGAARVRTVEQNALRDEARMLETLNRVGKAVAAELSLDRVVQVVVDAATELSGAAFGSFFYYLKNESGEWYWLYSLSGAPLEAFAQFPMVRNTAVFAPTFNGEGVVRSDDITKDPRYGHNAPNRGMPVGHLPVKSYLATPVISRSGEVLGGLLFGHPEPGKFDDRSERIVVGIASQASIAIDNARLYDAAQKEILERARIEAALRQSEDALREADHRKDEFLALLAHELRNPLAPIRNGLQILKLTGLANDRQKHAYEVIERQLSHLVRLVDDLLDVSRITRGKLELRTERVALASTIQDALETVRPAIEESRHQLTVVLPEQSVYLIADPVRLTQVFANLLSNAAKYTPPGGQVRLIAQLADDGVSVRIEDDGIGMPREALSSIFDMFTQLDRLTQRSSAGLGIGLALVKNLVEMHQGTVRAESEGPSRGSAFTVWLPIVYVSPIQSNMTDDMQMASGPAKRRVLVVDDNIDAASSMAALLGLMGHDIRTAHDGEQAIEAARAFEPDLILMDIGMPRMNGLEATRRIRQLPLRKRPIIAAVTGWGDDADRRGSLEAGFDQHLVKPVELEAVQRLLDEPEPG